VGDGMCCGGAVLRGPGYCECWDPVFDVEQAPADPQDVRLIAAGLEPAVRPDGMCGDCAYRPGSPERTGAKNHAGSDPGELDDMARGAWFFCHDGMRRPTEWVHKPSGTRIPGSPANYMPLRVNNVPYRANGRAGYFCAGWHARRKALEKADAEGRDLPLLWDGPSES